MNHDTFISLRPSVTIKYQYHALADSVDLIMNQLTTRFP